MAKETCFLSFAILGVILAYYIFQTKLMREKFSENMDRKITIQYASGKGQVALEAQRILTNAKTPVFVHSGEVNDVLIQKGLDVYRMSSIAPLLAAEFTVQNVVYFVRSITLEPVSKK
jgi:hypothetical protein